MPAGRTAPLPRDYPSLRERVRSELRPLLDAARQASLRSHELRGMAREKERDRARMLYALRVQGVSLRMLGIACNVQDSRISQITDGYRPGRGKR